MIAAARANLEAADASSHIQTLVADAGYWSEDNITATGHDIPELLIATTKDWKQRKAMRERGAPRGRIPKGLSHRELMERKLLTKRGHALYKKRGQTVEPVFGQIKDGRGADRFMRRGLRACNSEWKLETTTHNLLKLWRSGRRGNKGAHGGLSPMASAPGSVSSSRRVALARRIFGSHGREIAT